MQKKINVLLITSYFYPDNHVGSWRWERLVSSLGKNNFNFHIIAADNGGQYLKSSEGYPYVKEERRIKDLYASSFRWRYAQRNKKTGLQRTATKKQIKTNENISIFKIAFARLRRFISLIIDFPDFSWRSFNMLLKESKGVIDANDIDIIIASHPYLVTLRTAAKLSKIYDIPWIADMRDGITSNLFSPYLDFPLLKYFQGQVEKTILKSASKVVVINNLLSITLKCDDGKKFVISNAFSSRKNKNFVQRTDTINLAYAGSVKDGHLYKPFLDGLKLYLESHSKSIKFNYFGRDFHRLALYAKEIGINEDIMIDHGFLDIDSVAKHLDTSDLLVMFGWRGRLSRTYQSGKIFDYIKAGRPILGVSDLDSCLGEQIKDCNLGYISICSQEIARFLKKATVSEKFLNDMVANFEHKQLDQYSIDSTANEYNGLIDKIVKEQ